MTRGRNDGDYLPIDWTPDRDNMTRLRFRYPDLNVEAELEKFRDYWLAESGPRARKRDWNAALRTWMSRAQEHGAVRRKAAPVAQPQAMTLYERLRRPPDGEHG